jgi:hypothetical protein
VGENEKIDVVTVGGQLDEILEQVGFGRQICDVCEFFIFLAQVSPPW